MATELNGFHKNLSALRHTHGRSMQWIIDKYGKMDKQTFYTLLRENRFSYLEKEDIRYLIINGRNKK